MKLSLPKIRGRDHGASVEGRAGLDDAALKTRLAGLRADAVALAAEGPLYRIKRGKRSVCRVLQVSVAELHTALQGGCELPLLPSAESAGQADGGVHSELSPEDHVRWLGRVRYLSQSGGAGRGLFLAFGLVEMPGSGEGRAMQAPLLLWPARLSWVGVGADITQWQYRIAYADGPPVLNDTIAGNIGGGPGFVLPRPETGENPAGFLDRVDRLLTGMNSEAGVGVQRQVVLGVFDIHPAVVARDLDAARWPEMLPPWRHPVMARLLGSGLRDKIAPAEGEVLRLIHPANTAQCENLAAILAGNDLVIEGAPGSGRSLTVANLIAAAMEKGQKILLMADEPTALERVRQRLEAAGLGDFCLAPAGASGRRASEIERRLRRLGQFAAPRPRVDPAERISRHETALGDHAAWLDKGHNRLGLTARQVFVAALEHRGHLGQPSSHFRDIAITEVAQMDASVMARAEGDLRKFVQALAGATGPDENLAGHPWHGVTRATLNPTDWSALSDALAVWQRASEPIETALVNLAVRTGIVVARTPETVAGLAAVYAALPEDPGRLYPGLLGRAGDGAAVAEIEVVERQLTRVAELRRRCGGLFGALRVLPETHIASLDGLLAESEALGKSQRPLGELAELGQLAGECGALIAALKPGFGALATRLGETVDFSARGLRQLQAIITLAETAPRAALSLLAATPPSGDFAAALGKAESENQALQRMARVLSEKFDLAKAPPPRAIANATRDLARGGPLRGFSGDWRRAERVYRSVARARRRPDAKQMLQDLERLLAYQEHLAAFRRHVGYRQALGASFRGVETDFTTFRTLLSWREAVREKAEAFGNGPAGEALLGLSEADIRALAELPQAIAPWHQGLVRLLEIWPYVAAMLEDNEQAFDKLVAELTRIEDVLGRVGPGLAELKPDLSTPVKAMRGGLALLGEYGGACRALAGSGLVAEVSQGDDGPPDAVIVRLADTFAVISQISKLDFAEPLSLWLAEDGTRIGSLRGDLAALHHASQAWEDAYDAFAELAHLEKDLWLHGLAEPHSYKHLRDRGARALGALDKLADWIGYLRAARVLEGAGLAALGELVEQGVLPPDKIIIAYRTRVFEAMARDLLIEQPRLATATGRDFESLLADLQNDSRVLREQARQRIGHGLDMAALAYGKTAGAGCFDALAEQNAGPALQALKPCFMMTPSEVAALDPATVSFDLAIILCGSGMSLATAAGSVVRAKQLVVVGNCAGTTPEDEGVNDVVAVDRGAEDLMAAARRGLGCLARLDRRYGAGHAGLFALLNDRFYGGTLALAAAPDEVAIEKVATNGIFERGVNPIEGDAVVDAALDHMLTRPGASLGIIAMTGKQARFIDSELQRRAAVLPATRAFLAAREVSLEPVWVWEAAKMPEEGRDNLLVSVTFGPNNKGQLLQSFPGHYGARGWRPVSTIGGAVRKRMSVFSSIEADDVLVGPETGAGVRALRGFLELGGAPAGFGGAVAPAAGADAGLFAVVAAALRRQGLVVVQHSGGGGETVALGIEHPRKTGRSILGLVAAVPEDPTTWRQQASLVALGWQLYRLYEPDCFKDLDGEIRRIISRIEAIQAGEKRRERRGGGLGDQVVAFKRAVMAGEVDGPEESGGDGLPLTPTLTRDEARYSLVALREHVIKPACPAADPAHDLLRDPMLDLLLAEVPRTPEAFRSAISVKQLQETDVAQLEAYLGRVLEIVARIAA